MFGPTATMTDSQLASVLRARTRDIIERWRRDLPSPSPVLVERMPSLIEALATWMEGERSTALAQLHSIARAHAFEHHRAGRELTDALTEHHRLREAILEIALEGDRAELATSLSALATALDHAITETVARYEAEHDHVRERFMGMLVHDLRDPLTAVTMSASLLADMTLGDRQSQLVGRITRGARRIERMIDEVVDFARSRLGEPVSLTPATFDMAEVCTEVILEARAMPAPRDIQLDVAGNVTGTWDRERVRQALVNLIANATQSSQGPIRVRVHESEHRDLVVVAVTNRGPAIPPELLSRVFDPLARAMFDQTRIRGLGLGLYMVDQIVRAHGGSVRADSTAADGTTIVVEWPRKVS